MAQIVVAQRMWQRRDTAANWTAKNPILEEGEIGVQISATSGSPIEGIKIGNGVTPWADLAFFGGSGGGSTTTISDTPPASPSPGSGWVDSTTGTEYIYYDDGDSQQWVEFGPARDSFGLQPYGEGSVFPSTPANGDKFYRSDLNLLCYFDSTLGKWLTVQEFQMDAGATDTLGYASNDGQIFARFAPRTDLQVYLTRWNITANHTSSAPATNYWNVNLQYALNGEATVSHVLDSVSTQNKTSVAWVDLGKNLNVSLDPLTVTLMIKVAKVGTASLLYVTTSLSYRLIIG